MADDKENAMTAKYTVSCTHFDICFSDYISDWGDIVVGVEGSGQTAKQMADEVADEADGNEDIPESVTRDMLRAAVLDELRADARFWPHDAAGNEVDTDTNPDAKLPEEQSSYWFRFTIDQNDDTEGC